MAVYGNYSIGNAAVTGLLLLINVGLFLASLFVCRRHGDQARGYVTWMKISFMFFSGYLFFNCLTSVLIVLYYNDLLGTGFNVTSNLEVCFEMIVKVLIVATLGSLVRGIFYARSSKPAALAMPFRVFAFVLVGLVSLLTIVFLGVAMHATFSSSSRSFQSAMHANKIWGAIQIVLFIVSLALVAIAGFTFTKVKSMAHLRTASTVLIVACVFFFVQNLYSIVWIGLYGNLAGRRRSAIPPEFSVIINLIFGVISLFATLVTLFHLARSKDKFASAPTPGPMQAAPVQYPSQPGVPVQGYPQYQYAQPTQPAQAYAYAQPHVQPQGQPAWQPGMYYYPQQQVPQGYAPQQVAGQQPVYPPNIAQLPAQTPQLKSVDVNTTGPTTVSATSTPAPPSELGQGVNK
ncbi:hypothetical protein jhhlp_002753 [Lomentospora prolificans]|uniref:Uncharacterized protein n=1 Tax=Lomentospora prolificans TaxID=41688 RepID=A0A2N3NEY4_9PEZI|nr:hypothetical protein jhhlp_002753 [Lomentospora prolificans]